MTGLALGHVADVEDPEQLGRVKLTYPTLGDEAQSDWASVASIGAGPDAGAYFMPEPGDVAVVGFIAGHINQPIVLGFIWSGDGAPPGATPQERVFKSRKGHSVTLSDEAEDGILIEDSHGNKILMNKDGITIETGKALNIKAGSTATIEASGEATMKGSPIQLNP
ncbi:MAG TPA: phage baseplate assembly protein V [Allosphingosinicella sp.]